MNNEHFRDLLNASRHSDGSKQRQSTSTSRPAAFGSRKSAFVPRNVKGHSAGVDFARELAQRKATSDPKKHSTTSGQRGLKLGNGYEDRALKRLDGEDDIKDEREVRIAALADQVKAGKLSKDEFERLCEEIAGGEVGSTHLVKGLDRKLLERVRKGEDVLGGADGHPVTEDVDEELDDLEGRQIETKERQQVSKKGEIASPPQVAGVKRSRDDILKALKAQRQAEMTARQAVRPELDARFRSIQTRPDKPKVKLDSKGREVVLVKDEHGNIKKRVRPAQAEAVNASVNTTHSQRALDADVTVPTLKKSMPASPKEDSEPEAMFDDVDDDYNPLRGLGDDSGDSEEETYNVQEDGEIHDQESRARPSQAISKSEQTDDKALSSKPRNYFLSSRGEEAKEVEAKAETNPFQDPSFLSAVSRAGNLAKFKMQMAGPEEAVEEVADAVDEEDEESRIEKMEKEERLRKKREMLLKNSTRDMDDMDLGFGGGRFEDDDDGGEDGKIRLSEWTGRGDDDSGGEQQSGKSKDAKKKRSRGKRKGDKNDAKDVLEVLKQRQG